MFPKFLLFFLAMATSTPSPNATPAKAYFDRASGKMVRGAAPIPGAVQKWSGAHELWRTVLSGEESGDGQARLGEPHRSAWVFAAIRHIAKPIQGARLKIYRESGADEGALLNDDALSTWWTAPSVHVTGEGLPLSLPQVIGLTVAIRQMYGAAYWILPQEWMVRTQRDRSRFVVAGPRQLSPIKGAQGLVKHWLYTDNEGRSMPIDAWRVVNLKLDDPANPQAVEGFAPWLAAAIHAETEFSAATFAKRLMDRNGDLGSYLVNKSGTPLSDPQVQQIQQQLRAKSRAEAAGRKAYPVIGADVEIVTPGLDSTDSDFVAQRFADREAVFVAFGVPPSLSSKQESYSIGSASDLYHLIVNTCLPEAGEIARYMALVSEMLRGDRDPALPQIPVTPDRRVRCEFDFSDHPVMRAARMEKFTTASQIWDRGMPWETANLVFELGMEKFSGWDIGYVPAARVPVEGLGERGQDSGSQKSGGDVFGELSALVAKRFDPAYRSDPADGTADTTKARRQTDRPMLWAKLDRQRAGWRKRFEGGLQRVFFSARAEMLKKLRDVYPQTEAEKTMTKSGSVWIAFDLEKFTSDLIAAIRGISEEALWHSGESLLADELGIDDPMERENPAVRAFLIERENLTRDLAEDTWQGIQRELDQGIAKGESIDELAQRIKDFPGLDKARAKTIAVTETGAAFEQGRDLAMKQAEVEYKEWLSSQDDRVRESHRQADGMQRRRDEPFHVGKALLLHPCDGTAHPEEVVNCRCVSIPVLAGDEDPEALARGRDGEQG